MKYDRKYIEKLINDTKMEEDEEENNDEWIPDYDRNSSTIFIIDSILSQIVNAKFTTDTEKLNAMIKLLNGWKSLLIQVNEG